jgi:nucleoside-diphosphate-sugar epimerase
VHLASLLPAACEANPLQALKVNCEGTLNVFEAAVTLGVAKVAWASTAGVFGTIKQAGGPIANDAGHAPFNLYGATKSLNESLGVHYEQRRGLDNVGLRFNQVYGYGQGAKSVRVGGGNDRIELLEKPALGRPRVIAGGNDVVSWLYVEDAARAVCLASEAGPTPAPALTICGDLRPVRDAVAYVRQLLPDADLTVKTDRPGAFANFDSSVTEAAIGYRFKVKIEEGFRTTINAIRGRNGLPAV